MQNFARLLFIFAGCFIYLTVECYGMFIDNYCWRDYNGVAPSDAIKGGEARDGSSIYIGQTLYDDKLIPGKIHEDSNEIHVEFVTVHTLKETIKILCSDHPEKFEWVKVRINDVINMKDNKHLFEGGYEKGFFTYVGRALSHGETTVGKVVCYDRTTDDRGCYKLTTIENGTWYDHGEFEILTYNPDVKESSAPTPPVNDGYYSEGPTKPGFLSYFFLVLVVAVLVVLVIVLVRRC